MTHETIACGLACPAVTPLPARTAIGTADSPPPPPPPSFTPPPAPTLVSGVQSDFRAVTCGSVYLFTIIVFIFSQRFWFAFV